MKGQRSVSTTPVVLIPTLDSLHLTCPCVHMAVSLCPHGCVLVFTWLCPCVHMAVSLCSHGCVLVSTWLCPCVHMAVSLCSHGCVLVSTWLCPCVHMAVSLCSHGCVLVFTWLCPCQSVSNTGQSASDLSFVFTWLCPCVHMAVSLCSHGCVLVFTWLCPCVHMAVSLSVCVKQWCPFMSDIRVFYCQTSVAACVDINVSSSQTSAALCIRRVLQLPPLPVCLFHSMTGTFWKRYGRHQSVTGCVASHDCVLVSQYDWDCLAKIASVHVTVGKFLHQAYSHDVVFCV